jgi:hypothetical protein
MKKLLLLSLLVLFSCSKDSEEENAAPGDEIIGTHQIIYTTETVSEPRPELISVCCTTYYPFYSSQGDIQERAEAIVNGNIEFNNSKKGKVNVEFLGISPDRMSINFDWSFDGARWNLIDEYNSNSSISFFDGIYKMTGEMNNNRVEIYFR